jgi:hypothetical protein
MDYLLHNLRTGEAHLLDPTRTLIGTAPHATLRTESGPYLAALVVRYPGGWAAHGLSDDAGVVFNRTPLGITRRAEPWPGDVLTVGEDPFRFVAAAGPPDPPRPAADPSPCFAYVRYPDGKEECRAVDHDLLFGRRTVCHVRLPDKRLSRLTALLAAHDGGWYLHTLARCPVARNRRLIEGYTPVDDGDELLIGPLAVRVELRPAETLDPPTDLPSSEDPVTATDNPTDGSQPDHGTFHAGGVALDLWLRGQSPTPADHAGIGGWLEVQKERLQRFWYDTPEATTARALRAGGRSVEAFAVLDRAIRARPHSPTLLRELYRLYQSVGFADLCYRPLRQIEKLAAAHGESDPWVLEALAGVCERLGVQTPDMFDRAVAYWGKLEAATGVSRARERAAVLATRALHDGGYAAVADAAG